MQCSRYSFGIQGTKRVMVAGPLSIQIYPEESPVECYSGISLSKEIQVLQNMTMTLVVEDIHCIIVVQEADALEALANCTLFSNVPIILITTEGIPEFTTRFLLHRLSTEFPQIPMFGLVDWSPSGLEVLCSYKYGKTGSEFERNKLACSDMEWLGVTYKDIVEVQKPFEYRVWARKSDQRYILARLLQPLTGEDREIVRRLRSFSGELHDDYIAELDIMAERECKATTRAFQTCFGMRDVKLSAYVLSKVYTVSNNNRWFSKRKMYQMQLLMKKLKNC